MLLIGKKSTSLLWIDTKSFSAIDWMPKVLHTNFQILAPSQRYLSQKIPNPTNFTVSNINVNTTEFVKQLSYSKTLPEKHVYFYCHSARFFIYLDNNLRLQSGLLDLKLVKLEYSRKLTLKYDTFQTGLVHKLEGQSILQVGRDET